MPTSAPRTLADQFRGWSDEQLSALLDARPDLSVPAPQDSSQLAARVATRPSVMRALDTLSVLDLAVLEAALHLAPVGVDGLARVVNAATASVDGAVERLLRLALLWGTPEELRPVTVLAEVLASPRGPEPVQVPGLLTGLLAGARALLDHLDERDADGRTESLTEPVQQLVARRLVVVHDDRRHITVPWSVRVALRGGRSTREPVDVVPPLATSERDAALVDRAAAGAAFELVRRVELLLDHWGTHPPAVLRAGGLGVRDLRATAVHLHVEPGLAGLIVETAHAAGLLAPGSADDIDPGWLPTDAYDAWLARPVAERWAALAVAWLGNPRLTGLVGGRDEADRPVNALSPELERVWLPATRRAVLDELADAEGVLAAGTGPASLLARLRWRSPRRPANRERAVGWALDEAAAPGRDRARRRLVVRARAAAGRVAGTAAGAAAALPGRPRAGAGRPHRGRARSARGRPGPPALAARRRGVAGRGHRLPVRGRQRAARLRRRLVRGRDQGLPATPRRARRCRSRWTTSSTTSRGASAPCGRASRSRSCAVTTRPRLRR